MHVRSLTHTQGFDAGILVSGAGSGMTAAAHSDCCFSCAVYKYSHLLKLCTVISTRSWTVLRFKFLYVSECCLSSLGSVCFRVNSSCFWRAFSLGLCSIVSTSLVDYLERLVSEMTCYVSSGTLNSTQSNRTFGIFTHHYFPCRPAVWRLVRLSCRTDCSVRLAGGGGGVLTNLSMTISWCAVPVIWNSLPAYI